MILRRVKRKTLILTLARAQPRESSGTKAARHADDADGLLNVLPFAPRNAHAIGEMQPVGLGA